nr:uncharacterized protein LOC102537286 isoform X4 [Vicugna pacos]XP_031531990.1 uncharacterized protein LOC102537286 isoform X4 [Vicugna pacos]
MAVSTFRKLDGICWQVRQLYGDTGLPGRFLLQARGARGAVDVVVGETDYGSFAILYLERARQLSVKLYARSLPVRDSVLSVFEQRVQGTNLTEDHILFFPKYGFCEAADQFHILDGSTHRTVDRSLLSPFTATFELREDSRLEVSYAMIRGRRCVTWSYVLISETQPGKFSVDNSGVPGGDPEEVQVYDTDYTTFALVLSRRQSSDQGILRIYLLCRMWAIQTEVLDKFVCLVRAQGLSDNNIVFPDLTDAHTQTCRAYTRAYAMHTCVCTGREALQRTQAPKHAHRTPMVPRAAVSLGTRGGGGALPEEPRLGAGQRPGVHVPQPHPSPSPDGTAGSLPPSLLPLLLFLCVCVCVCVCVSQSPFWLRPLSPSNPTPPS